MAIGGRHLARRCAVQALYQWQLTGQPASRIQDSFIRNEKLTGKHLEYFDKLVKTIPRRIGELDGYIQPHLDRDVEKVDLIELAIIRVATYELVLESAIPTAAVINEAVDLAKLFSSEHGFRFVNGVLDKVAKQVRND